MIKEGRFILGTTQEGKAVYMETSMANRHGLVAGATGTGKTVTLKTMAEGFSKLGIPVFLADVKGDLTGLSQAGAPLKEKVAKRLEAAGLIQNFVPGTNPVRYWDILGKQGIPVRTTISDMGPLLISRILELNDTQSGVLNIVFRIADDEGLLLLDLKDLRSMLSYVGENNKNYTTSYGNIAAQTIGAIQRKLLTLEDQGGDVFFGEPALDFCDLFSQDGGSGMINILNATEIIHTPVLYSAFLLWMLSELFETLPEVGDLDKPKMVFFFDEAHLLFDNASKTLTDKILQIVRLIRSKGVGIYFITQSPSDLPDMVLAQLGNRVQHGLRAYTPKEQKAVKVAAQSFRENPEIDTVEAIQDLGVGEALISCLDDEGRPSMVERAYITPPCSSMGGADEKITSDIIDSDPLLAFYKDPEDRESSYELLEKKLINPGENGTSDDESELGDEVKNDAGPKSRVKEKNEMTDEVGDKNTTVTKGRLTKVSRESTVKKSGSNKKSTAQKMADTAATTFGRTVGRSLARGILGIIKKL